MPKEASEVHKLLADQGIRIFRIDLQSTGYQKEEAYWIHPSKTVKEWREDIGAFCQKDYIDHEKGWADTDVFNAFYLYLHNLGYIELCDVVADVFEGRITNEAAKLVGNADHDAGGEGFGHFGWENHQWY